MAIKKLFTARSKIDSPAVDVFRWHEEPGALERLTPPWEPVEITHTIIGSFGGALGVASAVGGATGTLLAHAARAAFMSGLEVSFLVGAVVSLTGVVIALVWLPSHNLPVPRDPPLGPVVAVDHLALTDDDGRSIVNREPGGARDASGQIPAGSLKAPSPS